MCKKAVVTTADRLQRIACLNILEVADVAVMLNISESRVRHLVAGREIPHHRNERGRISFLKSEVESWQLGTKVLTANELQQQAVTRNVVNNLK